MNKQIPHKFSPQDYEMKWQEYWEEKKVYKTPEIEHGELLNDRTVELREQKASLQFHSSRVLNSSRKVYVLDMFPYPSAQGLHVGHPEGFTATDIYARYLRMKGYDVLHPMGWDAFGLPAENYAIKVGVHPKETTEKAIANFTRQIKSLGFSYDWDKELSTCDPKYYRNTQWLFEFLYKEGLAYKKKAAANWCESCKTVLANEQVVDGRCERCKNAVIQKEIEQWFFKITDFADDLLNDLAKLDWPDSTKTGQTNWIGKSKGMLIKFPILQAFSEENSDKPILTSGMEFPHDSKNMKSPLEIEVFTTRPDTIYGVTFLVLAPEHPQVLKITDSDHMPQVIRYQEETKHKTHLERTDLTEKTGVFTGAYAKNPLTGEPVPIFISAYIVMDYGTGAIMGVPAHDKRDWDFASKMKIDAKVVCMNSETYNKLTHGKKTETIRGNNDEMREKINANNAKEFPQAINLGTEEGQKIINQMQSFGLNLPYEEHGVCVNSGEYTGLTSDQCATKISKHIISSKIGKESIKYKLRDWLISRQRYWGAPIPIIYCEKCGENLVPENELPVLLPTDVDFRPTGESPLQRSVLFHQVRCPKCGGEARRESDTMDTFVCSSWYFFAFTFWEKYCKTCANTASNQPEIVRGNPGANKIKSIFETYREEIKKWLPVDLYVGGAEHTVLHLLYSRFITKALYRAGLIQFDEPFSKLRHIGMILGLDGQKMSKSRGNVINPDEIVNVFGADTLRLYEMFMGPLADKKAWNMHGVEGCHRFLSRVWHLVTETDKKILDCQNDEIWRLTQKLVVDVESDIKNMKFNTAIAKMMEWVNDINLELLNYRTIEQEDRKASQQFYSSTVRSSLQVFLKILAPFAPHLTEELNFKLSAIDLNNYRSIHLESWPTVSQDTITNQTSQSFLVEVNGKVVEKITNTRIHEYTNTRIHEFTNTGKKDNFYNKKIEQYCLNLPKVQARLAGRPIKKTIFLPGKLINFVV